MNALVLNRLRLAAALIGMSALVPWSVAQIVRTHNAPTLNGFVSAGNTTYLIDADASTTGSAVYTRDVIAAAGSMSWQNNGGVAAIIGLRMRFRLVDQAGDPVTLAGGGTEVLVPASGYNLYLVSGGGGISSPSLAADLVPSSRLDPYGRYAVEVDYEEQFFGPVTVTGALQRVLHFQGTAGPVDDAPQNVITDLGVTGDPAWTKTFLVTTDPANLSATVNVPYRLWRYDNPLGVASSSFTYFRFTCVLRDDLGAAIPLADDTFDYLVSTQSHNPEFFFGFWFPRSPRITDGSVNLPVRPAGGQQLDPVSRTYRLEVSIGHRDVAGVPVYTAGNAAGAPLQRLLHFNGTLLFGSGPQQVPTTFTSVTNDPSAGAVPAGMQINTAVTIPAGAGSLDNLPGHTFGGAVNVGLLANGDAVCRAPSTVAVVPPGSPDADEVGGIGFRRTGVVLGAAGGTGDVRLIFPAGLGYAATSTTRRINGSHLFGGIPLDADLHPLVDPTAPFGPYWFTEETKPASVSIVSFTWRVDAGLIDLVPTGSTPADVAYVRANEYADLNALPIPAADKLRRSNERYYEFVISPAGFYQARADASGAALLDGAFKFDDGTFRAHFPYDAELTWVGGGEVNFQADEIDPASSRLGGALAAVEVPYSPDCADGSCGGSPAATLYVESGSGFFQVTVGGGLSGSGNFAVPETIRWGWINTLGTYAHQAGAFVEGSFHMSGHFLVARDRTGEQKVAPATLLFAGIDPATGLATERPFTAPYEDGLADYAGMNVRAGPVPDANDSGLQGDSVLAGEPYGPYPLKNRVKFYLRQGGVSGILDQVAGPPVVTAFYGYEVTLDFFGLAFLTNDNVDSVTSGDIYVKDPSDITQEFEELLFLCNGALDKATPAGDLAHTLAYWSAPIDVLGISFVRNEADACDPGTGYLALGVYGYSSHVRDTLAGVFGFFSNGNLIPAGFGLAGIDSRLKLPVQAEIRGPLKQPADSEDPYETYVFTPIADAYLNVTGAAPAYNPAPPADLATGFISLIGLFDVPFFENLQVHLHTASNRPPADETVPGAWGTATIHLANGAWSGSSFFDDPAFDDDNRGYPGGPTTATIYRTDPSYYTTAYQSWLGGAIEFAYPVVWNSSTRSFKSPTPLGNDFVVLTIEHEIKYMSAERLEVTFGASYGVPDLNVSSLVINAIDDATGMAAAAIEGLTQPIVDKIEEGVDKAAELVNDQMRGVFEPLLDPLLCADDGTSGLVDQVYAQLDTLWQPGVGWAGSVGGVLNVAFDPNTGQLNVAVFPGALTGLAEPAPGSPLNAIQQIFEFLDTVKQGIDGFIGASGMIEIVDGDGNVDTSVAKNLAAAIIDRLATEINGDLADVLGATGATDAIATELAVLLEDVEPSLRDLADAMKSIQDSLEEVRTALQGASDFIGELQDIYDTAINGFGAEFDLISGEINTVLTTYLAEFGVGPGLKDWADFSPAEIKARIRQEILDRFFGASYVADVQVAIKQRIEDLNYALQSAIDSALNQVADVVKEALSDALAGLDTAINDILGEFADYVGTGQIEGYAIFNQDALKRVRIDGSLQLKVPDEMTFTGYLEINQYTSEDDRSASCGPPAGGTLTEVKAGAVDVSVDWIADGMRIDVEFKLAMESTGAPYGIYPVGLGGSLSMTDGEISFEAFKITGMAAGVAFGKYENYVTAQLSVEINAYKAAGGVFFGRTCTLDPIKLWDPLVASALGEASPGSTFTGAYVYGEVWVPVSEVILGIPATCFFQVSAGMGAGMFFFLEGPTYGARIKLGISGDVLCIVSITGELDLVGVKSGGTMVVAGKGRLQGELGWCPVCITWDETAEISTKVGSDGGMKGGVDI